MTTDRREYHRAYYQANKERLNAADRARRAKDPETRRKYMSAYREANPEKWENLPYDRERSVAAARRWKRRNPEAVKLAGHRRRAKMRSAYPVIITERGIAARRAFLGERCWICQRSGLALTWDHVKPIAAAGIHALSNLRLACVTCNTRKGGKWYGTAGLARLVAEIRAAVMTT